MVLHCRIARVFTTDTLELETMGSLFNILLIMLPVDSVQTVIDGILRGLGRQSVAMKIKLMCMWGIRFPLAYYLGLHTQLGISGVWWGSCVGLGCAMCFYFALVARTDWQSDEHLLVYRQFDSCSLTDFKDANP